MRFEMTIPDASTIRVDSPKHATLGSETRLERIHDSAFGSAAFNRSEKGNARFSPIRNREGEIIPTIYAAEDFDCAAAEIILRSPDTPTGQADGQPHIVQPSDHRDRLHSSISLKRDLSLLEITIEGQRRIGVAQNALLAGPRSTYPATRSWAEAIHASFPEVDGLFYQSFQLGPRWALLLFGDRVAETDLAVLQSRPIASQACHAEIETLAASLGISYCDI